MAMSDVMLMVDCGRDDDDDDESLQPSEETTDEFTTVIKGNPNTQYRGLSNS